MRVTRLPGRRLGPEHRQEMLDLWDKLSPEARKMALFTVRAVAKEEGVLPEGVGLPVLGSDA